jgi:hypothetical protein
MSDVLTDTELLDLTKLTLKSFKKLKFAQIAQKLSRYEVLPRIMKKDKILIEDGTQIQRLLMVKDAGSARNVGLYSKDEYNTVDVMQEVNIPWRHSTNNYSYDQRELAMNGGPSKIVDLLKVKRTAAMLADAELKEADFWSKPVNSGDKLPIMGVQYWIVRNPTEGFTGGAPSGFSLGAGGLLHDNWKNWSAAYTNITRDDLIRKMRKATRKTKFESPVDIDDYRKGAGQQYRIYMNEATIDSFEVLAENQNDNLGVDLNSMDNSTTWKKSPLRYIPALDDDTQNPIYMLDWSDISPIFLKGWWLRENSPKEIYDRHTVIKVDIDSTWNLLFTDRRRHSVFYVA